MKLLKLGMSPFALVLTICAVGARADTVSSFGSTEVATAAGGATPYYYDCTASSEGNSMYCAPYFAAAVLKVDFTTDTVSSFDARGGLTPSAWLCSTLRDPRFRNQNQAGGFPLVFTAANPIVKGPLHREQAASSVDRERHAARVGRCRSPPSSLPR